MDAERCLLGDRSNLELLIGGCRNIGVFGLAKNAGKTTFLNAFLGCISTVTGVVSTGRDGEPFDALDGSQKPRITVVADSLVLTCANGLLDQESFDVLERTRFAGLLGNLVIARAKRNSVAILYGPRSVRELGSCLDRLKANGAEKCFVDGSMGRRAAATGALIDGIVLAVGAAFGSTEEIEEWVSYYVTIYGFAKPDETGRWHQIAGPLDEKEIERCSAGTSLCVRDPNCIRLTPQTLRRFLAAGGQIAVERPVKLLAIGANPFRLNGHSLDPVKWHKILTSRFPVPVIDVVAQLDSRLKPYNVGA